MRLLVCPECGVFKPTPPEDAARGLFERRVYGKLAVSSLRCDLCCVQFELGDEAIAISVPATMRNWEVEYFEHV